MDQAGDCLVRFDPVCEVRCVGRSSAAAAARSVSLSGPASIGDLSWCDQDATCCSGGTGSCR